MRESPARPVERSDGAVLLRGGWLRATLPLPAVERDTAGVVAVSTRFGDVSRPRDQPGASAIVCSSGTHPGPVSCTGTAAGWALHVEVACRARFVGHALSMPRRSGRTLPVGKLDLARPAATRRALFRRDVRDGSALAVAGHLRDHLESLTPASGARHFHGVPFAQ